MPSQGGEKIMTVWDPQEGTCDKTSFALPSVCWISVHAFCTGNSTSLNFSRFVEGRRALSQTTEDRKVEARKLLIFQDPIFRILPPKPIFATEPQGSPTGDPWGSATLPHASGLCR